jgi:hypothetical protein
MWFFSCGLVALRLGMWFFIAGSSLCDSLVDRRFVVLSRGYFLNRSADSSLRYSF